MRATIPQIERGRLAAAGRSETCVRMNDNASGNDRDHRRAKSVWRELCIIALTRDVLALATPNECEMAQ